jgi:hypothetical protein
MNIQLFRLPAIILLGLIPALGQTTLSLGLIPGLVQMAMDPGLQPPADLQLTDPAAVNPPIIAAQRANFAKLSPFQAVRWVGDTPQVKVDGAFYELVALNDVPVEKIVSFCKSTYSNLGPNWWQKRFDEHLVEVLSTMGQPHGCFQAP